MTFNDLEQRNDRYFMLYLRANYATMVEVRHILSSTKM